jgi:hypothetical protein
MRRTPLTDVRGSVDFARYRPARGRKGFCYGLLAILLLVSAIFGAEPAKLPEPFRSISDLASAAPPEFTADALLRIVESGKLADRNARRELVERAFQSAASAKFPVRMEGLPGTTTDTASGSMSQAYALKLDALSLESRAVRDMLPLDPSKARELFGQIVEPALAPLTCDDALVYEPSEFYQALIAVVNGAFTPKEKAKEEHVNLLLESLAQVISPSQLASLASALESAGVTAAQHQILWARFNGLLESMQPDDRSFAASLTALSALSTPGTQAALEKYRQKSHGCETDAAPSSPAPSSAATSPATGQPAKKPSTPKLDLYWQSANAQQLLQAGKKLRFASSGRLFTEADRDTREWQQQLADYLNLIADWTSDQEESDAVYFHEKCLVYTSLLDLVPGPQYDKIVADYGDFVSNSSLYRQSPAEWFVEPHALLDRSLTNPALHSKMLDAFQRSGNPVLALVVALEKTFGNLPSWAISAK